MPFAARTNASSSKQVLSTPKHTTIDIHHTKDGRKFVSHNNLLSPAKKPSCLLCNNKHANPWHPTENCPYKHPTQILPNDIRERVMQHNALHGAEKKDYTKDQDLPNTKPSPPQAASAITTSLEEIQHPSSPDTSFESHPTISSNNDNFDDNNEIIDTEYFDLPLAPPIANAASIPTSQLYTDLDPDTIITDPLQYLSYES